MLARNLAIGFGFAIVFPLLIYYGVSTFSPSPKRSDFFQNITYTPNPSPDELRARQEKQQTAEAAWNEANRVFSLHLLWVAAPLGYLAILLGSLRVASGLGTGFMFGGIFAVTVGYWWHWDYLEDWVHFISLILAMAVLVFVAYRQFPATRARQELG